MRDLEFLVVVIGVILAGVLVIFLWPSHEYIPVGPPAEVSQDKSVCAASGINLLSYIARYTDVAAASGKLTVSYQGKQNTCTLATDAAGDATCKLGLISTDQCMRIFVNSTGTGSCLINSAAEAC